MSATAGSRKWRDRAVAHTHGHTDGADEAGPQNHRQSEPREREAQTVDDAHDEGALDQRERGHGQELRGQVLGRPQWRDEHDIERALASLEQQQHADQEEGRQAHAGEGQERHEEVQLLGREQRAQREGQP